MRPANHPSLPAWMKGSFTDDYGIAYTIDDTIFTLGSKAKYHILSWNEKQQYLLTRNDQNNPAEQGLFTRIDYMQFSGMEPYTWGFCLTIYNAADTAAALAAPAADRNLPKKGCNGFPFSRMKRTTQPVQSKIY